MNKQPHHQRKRRIIVHVRPVTLVQCTWGLLIAIVAVLCIQWRASSRLIEHGTTTTSIINTNNHSSSTFLGKQQRRRQQQRFPPQWLLEYASWHAQTKQTLTADNWNATTTTTEQQRRYLIMTCLRTANTCGGLSDRLQHIPTMVQLAAKTNRLLLIYWETPAPLEEFLLPSSSSIRDDNDEAARGIDWRMPNFLVQEIFPPSDGGVGGGGERKIGCVMVQKITTILDDKNNRKAKHPVICARSSIHRKGQTVYDDWRQDRTTEPTFASIYHDFWRFLFTPSPPIASILQREMDRLNLTPGHYVMAHARALYGVLDRDDEFITKLTQNAIHCAQLLIHRFYHDDYDYDHHPSNNNNIVNSNSQQQQQQPVVPKIFFASDSSLAVSTALDYGNGTVVSATNPKQDDRPPLHLDRANSTVPSDYYDIFVDLYLLGNSRCGTFNVGGFGRWGALIGFSSREGVDGWNHHHHNRQVMTTTEPKLEKTFDDDFIMPPCWIEHNKRDCINMVKTLPKKNSHWKLDGPAAIYENRISQTVIHV